MMNEGEAEGLYVYGTSTVAWQCLQILEFLTWRWGPQSSRDVLANARRSDRRNQKLIS